MKNLFVVSSVALALFLAGCASVPKGQTDEKISMDKGQTDEKMLLNRVQDGIAAMKAKDYTAFDKFVSNAFSCPVIGDKAAFLDALKMADSMGLANGFEADLSLVKVVIDGNKCTFSPVTVNSYAGSITITGYGAKEDGIWMVVGGEQSY